MSDPKNVAEIKVLCRIVLVSEERLRELGVKITDDDGYESGNNVELESTKGLHSSTYSTLTLFFLLIGHNGKLIKPNR